MIEVYQVKRNSRLDGCDYYVTTAMSQTLVDLILDMVGGSSFESVNQCLAHRGRHVVIASIEPRVSFNLLDFYHREARLIGVDTFKFSFAESAGVLREVVPLVNAGVLTPPELDSIAIEQGPRAYQAVLEGSAGRKQVIRF